MLSRSGREARSMPIRTFALTTSRPTGISDIQEIPPTGLTNPHQWSRQWWVPSSRKNKPAWKVSLEKRGLYFACDCPSWTKQEGEFGSRPDCKHILAVRLQLIEVTAVRSQNNVKALEQQNFKLRQAIDSANILGHQGTEPTVTDGSKRKVRVR